MKASGAAPLGGTRIVDLSLNVPGPLATARLRDLGATVTKVEPPSGDPLAAVAPGWYTELAAGKVRETLDLKRAEGRERLGELLADADLLMVAFRPSALERLGLAWGRVHADHPRLCHVAIVGQPPPHRERPGHDLTYQAEAGLVDPPDLPRSLYADCMGAELAVSAALEVLLHRERTGEATRREVALTDAAEALAQPLRHGVTAPGGFAGGGNPRYGIYRAADGWVALAALEERLWEAFLDDLDEEERDELRAAEGEPGTARARAERLRSALEGILSKHSVDALCDAADRHGLPLARVSRSDP